MRAQAAWLSLLLSLVVPASAGALPGRAALQAADTTKRPLPDSVTKVAKLAPISVTATRTEQAVIRTAAPVLVVDRSVVREENPNGIADLFRNLPGVDVTGVGPNQGRLMIRGQRGQRILLLEDGVRLNNTRRQQDFGELPALSDLNALQRVEIVRGPASVLYGTDAIGGVVNLLTLRPPGWGSPTRLSGTLGYDYRSASEQQAVHGRVTGHAGRLGFGLSGGYRDAGTYAAPRGRFGELTLGGSTRVHDTGVRDRDLAVDLAYDLSQSQVLSVRVSRYEADDAGFGYVDPAALGDPEGAVVRLLYPSQDVTRVTAAYAGSGLKWGVADRFHLTGYTNRNDRIFDLNVAIPFGQPFPAGAGIKVGSRNTTDIDTYGFRAEAVKILGGRHTLTYGADWFLDHSDNTDSSQTTTTMFGPPSVRTSTTPQVPNANFWSGGLFAQTDLRLRSRFSVGLGVRGQTTHTRTRPTPRLPDTTTLVRSSNNTLVGSVSGNLSVTNALNLVAVVGRAFRAPNLVERYFEGVTPEGNAYQVKSPALKPETSLNLDLGLKYRSRRFYGEAFYFRNTIRNGIRIDSTGQQVGPFPAYQNVNVDRIRDQGVELLSEVQLGRGFAALGHFTKLVSKNVLDPNNPVGDSYSSKAGAELAWREPRGRFHAAYEIRHQSRRKDVSLGDSPVGPALPPFTVHNARASVRPGVLAGVRPTIGFALLNLGNRLYAEASNTAFFRPEPGRSALVTVGLDF